SSATIYWAVISYSIQIYFDFSGYSDMAIGVAKVIGFDLPVNFNLPYVSRSITEFWQRWHISLSTWLRDYLYIPLGGNRKGVFRTYVNLMLTMLLGGLWHGASWNFVFWGGLHGTYLIVERVFHINKKGIDHYNAISWLKAFLVFFIVSLTWIFFHSPSLEITNAIFAKLLFIESSGVDWFYAPAILFSIAVVLGGLLIKTVGLRLKPIERTSPFAVSVLVFEYVFVALFFTANTSPFIYFQF